MIEEYDIPLKSQYLVDTKKHEWEIFVDLVSSAINKKFMDNTPLPFRVGEKDLSPNNLSEYYTNNKVFQYYVHTLKEKGYNVDCRWYSPCHFLITIW